ncbi:hypothetical protein CORC01_14238 [Colletotrichum orchidophilum]|uniref:Chromo domain-containing protein n=1 Tax=Colletotrichum orchidophilum TaxID=1209926 RepID=A0A1G4AN67_9PEZI|nr:uncharacterized protein CORC01_14238 [Colletotrichum orchidophilum]OHE90472.1 hypothetical protein CORC01_14238 [Colletotrichum orchidophilum]
MLSVTGGTLVKGDWSPCITVRRVICTLQSGDRVFFGVLAENQESQLWSWPESDLLLWVFDDGQCVRVWQECAQRPHIVEGQSSHVLESIAGHHEATNGTVLYGVKWAGYECPTWELESDLWMHGYLLAAYHDTIQNTAPAEAFVAVET